MADTDPVNFSMRAARAIHQSVRVTQQLGHNERGRGRRWPIPEDTSGSVNSNTGTGSCSCCNPSNCIDYPVPLTDCAACDSGAREWTFNLGDMATALCSNLDLTPTLTHVSYCVYRSSTFQCAAAAAISGCSNSATCDCTGDVTWTNQSGTAWVATSNTCVGDGCDAPVEPNCTGVDGQEITTPCYATNYDIYDSGVTQGGATIWEKTGGNCTESSPPSRFAECTSEAVRVPCCVAAGDIAEGEVYSYFELSIDDTVTDGRAGTTLTLWVGDGAAVTWVMPLGKTWCCTCENKLELSCCGPWSFSNIPETICVSPEDFSDDRYVPAGEAWGGTCCVLTDAGELPRYMQVDISMGDDAYPDPCCSGTASGSFVLEYNATLGAYVYDFRDINDDACFGDCDDTPESVRTTVSYRMTCGGSTLTLILQVLVCANDSPCDTPPGIGICSGETAMSWTFTSPTVECDAAAGFTLTKSGGLDRCSGAATVTVRPVL